MKEFLRHYSHVNAKWFEYSFVGMGRMSACTVPILVLVVVYGKLVYGTNDFIALFFGDDKSSIDPLIAVLLVHKLTGWGCWLLKSLYNRRQGMMMECKRRKCRS